MENDPREIELDFNNSVEKTVGSDAANTADLAVNVNGFVDAAADSAGLASTEDVSAGENVVAEKNVAADVLADMPRSWQPMNRPAGTPPLSGTPAKEKMSAVELTISGKSYGIALRMLREHYQVAYEELEQSTRIQTHYLKALENEDLSKLPPLAYVIAFIRSLCKFYKLSSETGDQMVIRLKEQLEYTCNEEMINSLDVDDSGAEVNERRIKRIIFGFAGVVVLLAILIIGGILLFKNSDKPQITVVENPEAKVQHFDPNTIESLLEPPTLDLPKLPVAE